jgi:hypothetical protein
MKGGAGSNGKIIFSFSLLTNLTPTLSGSNKTIDIYPNPATDKLDISSANKAIYKIQLVDLNGKVVYTDYAGTHHETIDLSRFIRGLYYVLVYTNDNIFTEKVIIN